MARPKRTNHTTNGNDWGAPGDPGKSHAPVRWSEPSQAEIAVRAASALTPVERQRWRVLRLLADKTPIAEIEAATSYRPRSIRRIAQRYRELGPAGLADARQHSPGAPPLLSHVQQRELWQALQGLPPDGGVWTGPKVAEWIAARTGRRVHRQRGWEYLRRLGADTAASFDEP